MQEINLATFNTTNLVIPENAFRLDPANYAFLDGKLNSKPDYQAAIHLGLGIFAVALGILYFTVLTINRGGEGVLPGLLFLLGLGALGGIYLRKSFKANKFKRSRTAILGELLSIKGQYLPNQGEGWHYLVTAEYKFNDPKGMTRYRTETCQRDDLRDMSLPGPGTPVVVLYLNPKEVKIC